MIYTWYEICWFFFIYAFCGWIFEVVYAAVCHKKFANRGFINGPICPVYGFGMVFMLVFFKGLIPNILFLFLGSLVVTTFLEFFTGMLLEKLYGRKWWDYSDYKFNINGYVCLRFSLIWAAGAVVLLEWVQPLLNSLLSMLPRLFGRIFIICFLVCFICDELVTTGILLKMKRKSKRIKEIADGMNKLSDSMGGFITRFMQKRMAKAFPNLNEEGKIKQPIIKTKSDSKVFAEGVCFHKLVWLFFAGSFIGDLIETVFCYFTMGRMMSRSSVLYGPFSIVWGLGMVVLTLLLDRYRHKRDSFILIFGTVVGGVYEYICSVFTELCFGTIFWDYSKIPFNLGGRINLLFCFFWGIVALIWLKLVYPFASRMIEKIPKKLGTCLSYIFVVFMIVNMALSGMALYRYSKRAEGIKASNVIEQMLDEHYKDERMEKIYPNAKLTKNLNQKQE